MTTGCRADSPEGQRQAVVEQVAALYLYDSPTSSRPTAPGLASHIRLIPPDITPQALLY